MSDLMLQAYFNQLKNQLNASLKADKVKDVSDEEYVLRAVFDVREKSVVPGLEELLRARVPFIFHNVKAELFSFWALGLDPTFHDRFAGLAIQRRRRVRPQSRMDDQEVARTGDRMRDRR